MMNLFWALAFAAPVSLTAVTKVSFGHHDQDVITFERQKFSEGEMPTLTYRSPSGAVWSRVLTDRSEEKLLADLGQLVKKSEKTTARDSACASPFTVEGKTGTTSLCLDRASAKMNWEFSEWISKIQKLAGVRR